MNLNEIVVGITSSALLFGFLFISMNDSPGVGIIKLSKAVRICKQHINSNIEYSSLPPAPAYKEGWQESCGELAEIIAAKALAKGPSKNDETDRAYLKSVIDDIR